MALIIERGNPAAWVLHFDSQLLAVVYAVSIHFGPFFFLTNCNGLSPPLTDIVFLGLSLSGFSSKL